MEGKGGSLNKELEFRSWHCGRQGVGSLNKEFGFRSKARGGSLNKELDFRLWHSGWQGNGSLNKEFDFRSWHCGRQGGQKFTMALCKGKGGEVQIKT